MNFLLTQTLICSSRAYATRSRQKGYSSAALIFFVISKNILNPIGVAVSFPVSGPES